jgi:hypothetical protein
MTDTYRFRAWHIPSHMMERILAYTEDHNSVGDFLTAVICNDLRGACAHADDVNIENLPAFCAYFHNIAPSQCWGSVEKWRAWLDAKKEYQA